MKAQISRQIPYYCFLHGRTIFIAARHESLGKQKVYKYNTCAYLYSPYHTCVKYSSFVQQQIGTVFEVFAVFLVNDFVSKGQKKNNLCVVENISESLFLMIISSF